MMKEKIIGVIVVLASFLAASTVLAAGEPPAYRTDSMETTKKFSETALESLKSNSGENIDEAARVYGDLTYNEALIKASDKIYRDLSTHQAFAATLAEHIMKGGASFTQTQAIMAKLALSYGKALAEIIKGGAALSASGEFVAELKDLLQPHCLKPKEHSLTIKCAEAHFKALGKILGR
ncbi:MAG: hypothetical protein PHE61_07100 [Candidatus Omnitrophica bacterium]|nr:hypothetical protein [Candidatus Omnitrophota bacterium]